VRHWSIEAAGEDTFVTLDQAGTVRVHTDPETGQIRLSTDGTTFHAAALDYDPLLQMGGQRIRRRDRARTRGKARARPRWSLWPRV